ncbi:hypothetical protein MCAP1_003549 [Malassezia caprae]|uniref:Major facilitator superfamily (MFS) profile domain-containing protein n=1 Tax=Malassezia caprae TaxID=1381934 RepID=A0AAF0EBG0_9BASI|nr:hypothetical protein MCAP1_003549 [Malassezia caprae]
MKGIDLPTIPGSNRIRGTALTVFIAFVCSCGFLLFGYDQGVMSLLIEEPMLASTMPQIAKYEPDGSGTAEEYAKTHPDDPVDYHPKQFDSNVQGAVVSCYELGCMVGSLFLLWKGDAIGRRWSVVIGSTIMIIGVIIMVADDTIGPFTAGRVIAGVGNGFNTTTIPMLQSELSRPQYRGLLVFIEGALLAGGVMISYWLDFAFYFLKFNSVQWRFPVAFQIVFALVLMLGVFIMPESPRWLVKRGRVEEANAVLSRLHDKPMDDPAVQQELNTLVDAIRKVEMDLGPFKYSELVTMGPQQNFYRLVLGCGAQCMQQWTGINNLTYYASTVFKMVQPNDISSRLLVCGSGVLYFLAAAVAVFLIDVAGRRTLMISCAFGMMLCYAIISGMVYMVDPESSDNVSPDARQTYGKVAEAFIYLYFIPWSFGWLGMTWLYPPEIMPIRIRAAGTSLSTCTNWLMNFTVVMISPPAFENLKNHTFTMFGAFNFIFMPIVYMFYPETNRRGLEEMDLFFADAHQEGFWKPSRFMTTAAYLSITRPYLSSEELDAIISKRNEMEAIPDSEANPENLEGMPNEPKEVPVNPPNQA